MAEEKNQSLGQSHLSLSPLSVLNKKTTIITAIQAAKIQAPIDIIHPNTVAMAFANGPIAKMVSITNEFSEKYEKGIKELQL